MATRSRKPPEASSAAPPPAGAPETDPSQNLWLAGVDAMARAHAEGSKALDALVKQGLDWQSQAREQIAEATERAEAMAAGAAPVAAGRWNALEGIFEQRVARALASLGLPDAQTVARLEARIAALEQALATRDAVEAPAPGKTAQPRTAGARGNKP